MTITYFNGLIPGKDLEANQTTIGKILEEQTGVNVKFEHLVGDINTKIGTMIASNEYPDVLNPDIAIDKILDAGAFIPLNDLIEEHAPNLKNMYEPYFDKMRAEDGNIYYLPFGATQNEYKANPNIDQGAFWIQRGVLKEFGYPKVKTLDEYFDLIKKYQEKHPQVAEGKTIGFTLLTHDWRFFTTTNPPMHLAGYPNDGNVIVDMKTHEAKIYADKEETKRWVKKLNEANSQGLFDKETFVGNYDEYVAKLTSGRVLGFFDYGWQVGQVFRNLKGAGNPDKEYVPLPIVFESNIKDQYLDPPAFVNNRGVGITVSAKDPVRIIQYFDNLAKEENQKMIMYGVPGETYEIDANGRFFQTMEQYQKVTSEKFREEFGFKDFEWAWSRGNGTFSDGNAWEARRQPEIAQLGYSDADKETLQAYGVTVYSEMFAAPDERPWYPTWSFNLEQGSPAQITSQKMQDIQRKHYPRMVLASPDQFETEWNAYVSEINKLDVKAFEEKMTQVVKDRLNNKW